MNMMQVFDAIFPPQCHHLNKHMTTKDLGVAYPNPLFYCQMLGPHLALPQYAPSFSLSMRYYPWTLLCI